MNLILDEILDILNFKNEFKKSWDIQDFPGKSGTDKIGGSKKICRPGGCQPTNHTDWGWLWSIYRLFLLLQMSENFNVQDN